MPHHQSDSQSDWLPGSQSLAKDSGAQPGHSQHIVHLSMAEGRGGKGDAAFSLSPAHPLEKRDPPAQCHPASKWLSKNMNPGVLGSGAMLRAQAGPIASPSARCLYPLSTPTTCHSSRKLLPQEDSMPWSPFPRLLPLTSGMGWGPSTGSPESQEVSQRARWHLSVMGPQFLWVQHPTVGGCLMTLPSGLMDWL